MDSRTESFWAVTIRQRFFSVGLVIATGFLLLTSLVVTAVLSAAARFASNLIPMPVVLLECINFVLSFGMITILFAVILKFIPDTKISWRDVRIGASDKISRQLPAQFFVAILSKVVRADLRELFVHLANEDPSSVSAFTAR